MLLKNYACSAGLTFNNERKFSTEINVSRYKCYPVQRRAQEFKNRGGNLKPSVFSSKSSKELKKVNTSADVQFSGPMSSEEQKKRSSRFRLSFIRISPLHHESFVHLSAGRGGGPSGPPGFAHAVLTQGMLWNGMKDDFSIFHTAKFFPCHM